MKATFTLEESDMKTALSEYFEKRGMRLDAVYYRRYHDKQSKDKRTNIVAKCDVEIIERERGGAAEGKRDE